MNHKRLTTFLRLLAIVAFAPAAFAMEAPAPAFKPAIIYEYAGEKSENAYINAARNGANKAESEFHTKVTIYQVKLKDDLASTIRRAASAGASPIILLGEQNIEPVLSLAGRFPGSNFTVIDGAVPPIYPNVQSIIFRNNEGAFLVGLIAGKMSRSETIGFIGGMESPLMQNFAVGFTHGVRYAAPEMKVDAKMVGTTAAAWNDQETAYKLAKEEYENGVDIIYAAAGGSGMGVLKAAAETGKLAIGSDINQNGLYPGHVLTSMIKRVDVAVYETIKSSYEKNWTSGTRFLGIKEGALDYAVDQNNRTLFNNELIEAVSVAKDRIIDGGLVVNSYQAPEPNN